MRVTIARVAVYFGLSAVSFAPIFKPQRYPDPSDCERASLICSGVPTNIVDSKVVDTDGTRRFEVHFEVDRRLKGRCPPVIRVSVVEGREVFSAPPQVVEASMIGNIAVSRLPIGQRSLLFLTEKSPGNYEMIDTGLVVIPLAAPAADKQSADTGIMETLTEQLTAAIADGDPAVRRIAVEAVVSLRLAAPAVYDALELKDPKDDGRFPSMAALSLSGRIRLGYGQAIDQMDTALVPGRFTAAEEEYLCRDIERLRDQRAAVPHLVKLFASPNAKLRRAASSALRGARGVEIVRLFRKGLGDVDSRTKFNCMHGLAARFPQADFPRTPGYDEFKSDEKKIVEPWLRWCEEHPRYFDETSP